MRTTLEEQADGTHRLTFYPEGEGLIPWFAISKTLEDGRMPLHDHVVAVVTHPSEHSVMEENGGKISFLREPCWRTVFYGAVEGMDLPYLPSNEHQLFPAGMLPSSYAAMPPISLAGARLSDLCSLPTFKVGDVQYLESPRNAAGERPFDYRSLEAHRKSIESRGASQCTIIGASISVDDLLPFGEELQGSALDLCRVDRGNSDLIAQKKWQCLAQYAALYTHAYAQTFAPFVAQLFANAPSHAQRQRQIGQQAQTLVDAYGFAPFRPGS